MLVAYSFVFSSLTIDKYFKWISDGNNFVIMSLTHSFILWKEMMVYFKLGRNMREILFCQWHKLLGKKFRVPPQESNLWPSAHGSDALPLSYRRLVGIKAIQLGSSVTNIFCLSLYHKYFNVMVTIDNFLSSFLYVKNSFTNHNKSIVFQNFPSTEIRSFSLKSPEKLWNVFALLLDSAVHDMYSLRAGIFYFLTVSEK